MKRHLRALPLLPSLLLVAAPSFAQTAAPAPAAPPPVTPAPVAAPAPAPTPAPAPVLTTPPPPPSDVNMPTPAAPPPPSSGLDLTTLGILKAKGLISQGEYDSALKDMGDTLGTKAAEANTVVFGKFATTIYGFVEADNIWDSTQSFNDLEGNGAVARNNTFASSNGRFQFAARNTRLGFRFKAPEFAGIRSSAQIEGDFLGNQMPIGADGAAYSGAGLNTASGSTGSGTSTEGQYFANPAFRIRHAYVKLETPVVDALIGQYWHLYGWQSVYHPNSVELQGLPGQLYSRTPQIRLSKTYKDSSFLFEIAVAAMRPPQRDADIPEGEAGIRIGTPAWSGVVTNGGTGTSVQPLSIAVTGDARSFRLPYTKANPNDVGGGNQKLGTSIAVDGFIPIIPAKKRQANALSVLGEFSTGYGNADMYTGLSGGGPVTINPAAKVTAPASAQALNIDPNFALYDNSGNLHLIGWTSYLFGLQYYLPVADGRMWISANISHIESSNLDKLASKRYGGPSNVGALLNSIDWGDVNLFADVTDAVRLGAEWALFDDTYNDGQHAQNHRVQFSAWYIF